ncbi:unnamed protein product [Rotaria socialis]|uniref:Uncharacterized protein n=1 Tax=Rotaria socialis TaxID=392032 RepID=A0A821VUI9_9BILA|nr:unnamed protein product [Rotaria socialis]
MARKRADNKKWKSRPSRKKSKNRNSKPSKKRKTLKHTTDTCRILTTLETNINEELFDATIIHTFLTERYLSEIRESWCFCKCCTCEHPYSNMHTAKEENEKYHDCVVDDLTCSFC